MQTDFFDRPLRPDADADVKAAYEAIFSMFDEQVPNLSPQLYSRFRKVTFPVNFVQDQVILEYGETCKHAFFAFSGLVRLTRVLESRGETTVMFLTGGDILISPISFYNQSPSIEKLTALMDTFCITLPWPELQSLYEDFIEFNVIARLLTERYYRQALERTTWFYENPELRYERVLKVYPELAERVSVKELASYLGMAPETLSRIRNRLAHKGKNPEE